VEKSSSCFEKLDAILLGETTFLEEMLAQILYVGYITVPQVLEGGRWWPKNVPMVSRGARKEIQKHLEHPATLTPL
jgi:hypothetical protein